MLGLWKVFWPFSRFLGCGFTVNWWHLSMFLCRVWKRAQAVGTIFYFKVCLSVCSVTGFGEIRWLFGAWFQLLSEFVKRNCKRSKARFSPWARHLQLHIPVFPVPCPALLTVDVVFESRWFAILFNSGTEAKSSPTAPATGIKAAEGGCAGSDRMPQDLPAHSVHSSDREGLKTGSFDWKSARSGAGRLCPTHTPSAPAA